MFWVILVVAVISTLMFSRIKAKISTVKRKRNFYIIKIYFLGIRVYKTALCLRFKGYINPQLLVVRRWGYKMLTDIPKSIEKKRKVRSGQALDTGFILRSLKAEEGEAEIRIGTGDAASTALISETLRTIAEIWLKRKGLGGIKAKVRPNFEKEEFSVWVDCILSSFAAHIIYRYFKQKGGS